MKNSPAPPLYPPPVADRLKHLEELTGVPGTCTRTGPAYLIEHTNGRVRATCTYSMNSLGKWAYATALWVDGKKRPNMPTMQAYARLFADPDLKNPQRTPGYGVPPVIPLTPTEKLPAPLERILAALPESDLRVSVGHTAAQNNLRTGRTARTVAVEVPLEAPPDPNGYVVQLITRSGSLVQLYYRTERPGGVAFRMHSMAAVDADGCDLMGEFGHDFERAIEAILGFTMPSCREGAPPPARRTDTRGHRANAVEVRRASVIRN